MTCAGPLSTTDFVLSLFLVILQVLRASVIISSLVLYGAECLEFSVISSSRNEEMSSGTEEMEAEVDAGGNVEGKAGLQDFRYALRKFRNHSENFAILAKISLCTVFR